MTGEFPAKCHFILLYIVLILPPLNHGHNTTSGTAARPTSAPEKHTSGGFTTGSSQSNNVANKMLQESILKMFGFSQRPKMKAKEGAEAVDELVRILGDKEKDQSESLDFTHPRRLMPGNANTVRSFYHIDENPESEEEDEDVEEEAGDIMVRLYFDLTGMPSKEKLSGAELRLYKDFHLDASADIYRIDIHDVIKSGQNADDTISVLVDTKLVNTSQQWESFDISRTVKRWIKNKCKNNQIQVRFVPRKASSLEKQSRVKRSTNQDSNDTERKKKKRKRKNGDRKRPHLMAYSDDGKAMTKEERRSERKRLRDTRRRRRKKWKDQCRRHKLYVDFNDVGWNDWIVAPPGYHAYYCHGECPMPLADHLNSTNHAIVQNLVNSAYPEAVPKACCVPTELSPISMLYSDETGQVVLKTYQEMVVQGCGCR